MGVAKALGLPLSWPSAITCNTASGQALFLAEQVQGGVVYYDIPYSSGNYIAVSVASGNVAGQSGVSYFCAAASVGANLFALIATSMVVPVY